LAKLAQPKTYSAAAANQIKNVATAAMAAAYRSGLPHNSGLVEK